ncbi:hypothetical protein [Thermovibrio sp.]
MGFLSLLTGGLGKSIVDGVKDLVDDFITTDEEKFEQMIKKAELQLKERKLQLEREKAYLQDTQSARETYADISTSQAAPLLNKIFPSVLAFTTVILTFILFFYFAQGTFQGPQKDIVIYILGVLSTITTQIFAFYFGSSAGSKDKDELIKKIGGAK